MTTSDQFFRGTSLLLITTAEPFEYNHPDWGDDILLMGASAWEPPQDAPSWLEPGAWPPGAESAELPLVLVTTSSEFQDDGVLVRTALETLADEPVRVVATMPAGVPAGLALPSNTRSNGSSCTARCWTALPSRSRTAGWARRDSEGAVAWRSGLCGSVRARPVRGRPTGRGERRRHAGAGEATEPAAAARRGAHGDGLRHQIPSTRPAASGVPADALIRRY